MNELYVIVIALVIINAVISYRVDRILFRHQKALEWFSKHVYLDDRTLPHDAPGDLADMLHLKEDKSPDTK
jgi:hypothetical protein